jgi:hypothetical protein
MKAPDQDQTLDRIQVILEAHLGGGRVYEPWKKRQMNKYQFSAIKEPPIFCVQGNCDDFDGPLAFIYVLLKHSILIGTTSGNFCDTTLVQITDANLDVLENLHCQWPATKEELEQRISCLLPEQ